MKIKILSLIFILTPFFSHAALTDNLISYWDTNETSGTRSDIHGTNDLSDNNTVLYGTGILNNGADFEKNNSEYLSITDATQTGLDLSSNFSISLWAKFESLHSGVDSENLINKTNGSSGGFGYQFWILDNGGTSQFGLTLSSDGSGSTDVKKTGLSSFSTGTWYHLAVSYNAASGIATFYINGSPVGTGTGGPSSIYNNNIDFTIGRFTGGSSYIDGILDEIAIYSRTLSDAEIETLYNEGNALAYPFTIPEPPIDSGLFGSSTEQFTPTLGDVSFGLGIIIVLFFTFLIAYIWNTINDKKKKPWHS